MHGETGHDVKDRKLLIVYPPELPITARRAEIVRAIRKNQVVIISGETGCGKSTQIPKMCLEAGRGRHGRIGCTQPRRIAAITIAHRIAEELGGPVGRFIGYKIRFDDRTSREARIKILTDGMLLAETQSDPRLFEYDTLMIDEAHERSLNIDFLLGIVKTLLPIRPELKLIITSATLDIEKFSRAFESASVLEVSGRLYPVDVEYRPSDADDPNDDEFDYLDSAVKTVEYLKEEKPSGDILIFMPTEQDILEACDRLEGRKYLGVTVLPLYARLPGSQQGRVYSVTGPKIVVATNVAETSLTIPGIKYVIDAGLARISQYLPGARINSLPIKPISQSSADQRKGRCGRVQKGLCVRLYSEDDYELRPQFTPPEILRSNLAEVILRMLALNLGHPLKFPFVDRPHTKNIEDGYATLVELGALRKTDGEFTLTERGRHMARMPLDPRISRMLLEAHQEGCLNEVAVLAAALSIRDPRERPPEKAAQADATHAPFRDPDSDFLTLLNIWNRYHSDFERLDTQNKRRKFCRDHFLSYTRMREWASVHDQILDILKELKIPLGRTQKTEMSKSLYAAVHKSILSGYLSNIAVHKEKNIYTAAKGREVMIFPGSTLFNKSASWIAAAEMVQTSRLFARTAAKISADWLEALGGDLCRYSYSDPRWDRGRSQVAADEHVHLYGLEIVANRIVPYGPINPGESHKIFVRSALVEGHVKEHFDFLEHNLDLHKRLLTMEEKLRRRDILVDEKAMAEFYSRRLDGVYDIRGLKDGIRRHGGDEFLKMRETDLLRSFPEEKQLKRFPDELAVGGHRFRAIYKFAPGDEDDGVTLKIPSQIMADVPAEPLEWSVPGLLREKITALIKGLPKRFRKLLVPVSDTVDIIMNEMEPAQTSLFEALARFVKRRFRADVPAAEWAGVELPRHLKIRVAVIDPHGKELAAGRDVEALKRMRPDAPLAAGEDSDVWKKARLRWERIGVRAWDFEALPEEISIGPGMIAFVGFEPAENGVNLRLFNKREDALASHQKGVETLLLLKFAKDLKFMERYLVLPVEYHKIAFFFGGKTAFEKMLAERLKTEVFRKNLRSGQEFKAYSDAVVRTLFEKGHALWEATRPVLETYQQTLVVLDTAEKGSPSNKAVAVVCAQIRKELEALVPKNFLEIYFLDRIAHLPRYVNALRLRAERAKNDPEKDRKKAAQIQPFVEALDKMKRKARGASSERESGFPKGASKRSEAVLGSLAPRAGTASRLQTSREELCAIEEFRWMVEEFKVSLFAPELKTAYPVSAKRLAEKIREIESDLCAGEYGNGA